MPRHQAGLAGLAALAALAALIALAALAAQVSGPQADAAALLSATVPLLNGAPHLLGTAALSYVSGPISAGPAAAHMDAGEPDAGAYLKDLAQRGRDPSVAFRSPSSEHTAPYHNGVNRWRERRSVPGGQDAFPVYWGTSEQDARAVAGGYEQGQAGGWGLGWGPNHNGEGKEGAPRDLSAAEKAYWLKAAGAYDSSLEHLYDAQDSADTAAWVAESGFYPGLAPRAPEYAANADDQLVRAASYFPPGLEDPAWYPGGHHPGYSAYYADYWDRMPEPYY
jgi:hypothetical protein